jgi:hypothetical protein
LLRKSFHEGIGVRSQESGGGLKISLPSLEISKNARFFSYTLEKPCTYFCAYHPVTFDISGFYIYSASPIYQIRNLGENLQINK